MLSILQINKTQAIVYQCVIFLVIVSSKINGNAT